MAIEVKKFMDDGHIRHRRLIFMPTAIRAAIMLLIGIVMFAGLPLLGWGVNDVHGFISNPARLGYIMLVVLLQLFIVIKFPDEAVQAKRSSD